MCILLSSRALRAFRNGVRIATIANRAMRMLRPPHETNKNEYLHIESIKSVIFSFFRSFCEYTFLRVRGTLNRTPSRCLFYF